MKSMLIFQQKTGSFSTSVVNMFPFLVWGQLCAIISNNVIKMKLFVFVIRNVNITNLIYIISLNVLICELFSLLLPLVGKNDTNKLAILSVTFTQFLHFHWWPQNQSNRLIDISNSRAHVWCTIKNHPLCVVTQISHLWWRTFIS